MPAARSAIADSFHKFSEALNRLSKRPDRAKNYHRLRVSVRRARVHLKMLKCVSDQPLRLKKLKTALRELFQEAGRVRRFDMALSWLADQHVGADELTRAALESSMAWLSEDRDHAVHSFQRMAAKRTRKLQQRIDRMLQAADEAFDQDDSKAGIDGSVKGDGPVMELLGERVTAVREASGAAMDSPAQMHELRIECKKLRYLLEALESESASDDRVVALIARLVAIQDELGALNDAHDLSAQLDEHIARLQQMSFRIEQARPGVLEVKLQELSRANHDRAETAMRAFVQRWEDGGRDELMRLIESALVPATEPRIEILAAQGQDAAIPVEAEAAHD